MWWPFRRKKKPDVGTDSFTIDIQRERDGWMEEWDEEYRLLSEANGFDAPGRWPKAKVMPGTNITPRQAYGQANGFTDDMLASIRYLRPIVKVGPDPALQIEYEKVVEDLYKAVERNDVARKKLCKVIAATGMDIESRKWKRFGYQPTEAEISVVC